MPRYALLCCFILSFSTLYTFTVYSVANNPWVSTFITAAGAVLFVLENMELNRVVREMEGELESTKKNTQIALIPTLNDLQDDVKQLKACIAAQTCTDGIKKLKRHGRSSGSL